MMVVVEEGEEEDTPNDSDDNKTSGNRNEGSDSITDNPKDEDKTEVVIGDDEENKPSTPSEEDKPNAPEEDDKPSEDETDKSAPIVTILDKTYQGPDNKIGYVNTDVVLSLVEENLNVSITLNDEALEFSNGMTLSSDGTYRLSVKDDAGNETVVEFSLDKTAPKFNVASGTHSDKDINIKVEDASLAYITIYNQDTDTTETKEGTNEFTLSDEATYKITAYDKLGNETTIWVAIDETDPKIEVTGTNEFENKFGGEVTLTVSDKFLTEVTVNDKVFTEKDFTSEGNNENRTLTLTYEYDSKNSGTYTVSAKDKFGHINTDEFTIDNDAPESKWVYILSADEDNRTIIGNNQKLIVEINVNEELAENPVITIGDWTGELTRRANDSRYIYSKTITIDAEEMKLVHAENIKFTIEVTDIFGNTTTLDNDNVTYHEENGYGQVKYDGEAPELINLGITGYTSEAEFDAHYVKNGKGIRILAYFNELLAVNPTITINGYEYTAFKATDDGKNSYSYFVDIPDISTLDLTDGIIKFTVSGYEDKLGNVGDTKTEADITLSKYNKVIVDNTLPEFNFTNGDTFSKFTVKITEENIARLEVYSYGTGKTTTYEGEEALTWELTDGNCMYKLTAYDLAGNMDEIWIYHDRTAPSVTGTGKVASKDVEFIPGNKYQEVNLVVTDNDLKEVKIVNQLTKEEEVICKFNWDNTQDCVVTYDKEGKYQLVVTDRANNSSTYEFTIDTTAPKFDLSEIPAEFKVGVDVYEYPQPGKVTDNMDGALSFSNVNMNWYQKNADGTKGESTKCFGYDNWNTSLKACPLGDYLVTYDIRDEAGNKAYVEKVITLKDTTSPTIILAGTEGLNQNELRIETGSKLTLEDVLATVADNYDKERTIEPYSATLFPSNGEANVYNYDFKTNGFDTNLTGRYNLYYKTTDSSGNSVEAVMLVVITDTTAPEVTGLESNMTYFVRYAEDGVNKLGGGFTFKITDNSKKYRIYINDEEWRKIDNDYTAGEFAGGMPYQDELKNANIRIVDESGNETVFENISVVKFDAEGIKNALSVPNNHITLVNDVTMSATDFANIADGVTIYGNSSNKITGSLNITANNITLNNVNIEGIITITGDNVTLNNVNVISESTVLNISPEDDNVVINGGVYNTTSNLQGQGTIRLDCTATSTCSNEITIKNATIMGAIHLLNYDGSLDNIKDNNLTLNNVEGSSWIGILVTSDSEKYVQETLNSVYNNNKIQMNYYESTANYYAAIRDTNWNYRYYVPVLNPNA